MSDGLSPDGGQLFVGHREQIRDLPDYDDADLMLDRLVNGGLQEAWVVPTDEALEALLTFRRHCPKWVPRL